MKVVRTLFILLMVAAVAVSCSNPKKKIAKKWHLSDFQSPDSQQLTDEQKKKIFEAVSFEFKEDGKLIVSGFSKEAVESTWDLSKDGKAIVTKDKDGKEESIDIKELTDSKMVLSSKKENQEITMTFVTK
jgi:WD40 repeat protein